MLLLWKIVRLGRRDSLLKVCYSPLESELLTVLLLIRRVFPGSPIRVVFPFFARERDRVTDKL